jgi:hypothetical protein
MFMPFGIDRPLAAAAVLLVAAASGLGATPAAATEYTYHYVGNNFTEFAAKPSKWDGNDRVELRLTLPAPIDPNLNDEIVDLTNSSIEISDGVKTYTRNIPPGSGNVPAGSGAQFKVTTDADGNFVRWLFTFSEDAPDELGEFSYAVTTGDTVGDTAYKGECKVGPDDTSLGVCKTIDQVDGARVQNNPGTWTLTETPQGCTIASLYAGQDELVGLVRACPFDDTVKFELSSRYADAGYCFSELHLAYGEWNRDDDLGDPGIVSYLNKQGSPSVGRFPYAFKAGCTPSYTFENLNPHLKAGDFVAAHAVVVGPADSGYKETAWAASTDGNNRQFNHKSWATYFKVEDTGTLDPSTGKIKILNASGEVVEVIDPPEPDVLPDYVDITIEADAKCAQCSGLNCLLNVSTSVARCPESDPNRGGSGGVPNVCYTIVRDPSPGREIERGCAVAEDLNRVGTYDLQVMESPDQETGIYRGIRSSTNGPDARCANVENATVNNYDNAIATCVFVCDGTKDSSGCNRPLPLLPVSQDITNTVNGGAIKIEGYVAPNPAP